jgi:hypothetical protein
MIINGVEKARFALRQAESAAALADALADPFDKRFAARGVFVALASFIDIARQTRNQVSKTKANATKLATVKTALNALADRDWGPYRPLRDRIGAHRQPIGDSDGPLSWRAANELFAEIDRPLVEVLRDDMQSIFNDLAGFVGADAFVPRGLSPDVIARITAARPATEPGEVAIATGSFGETIANSLTPIQCGAIGERLRQVADAVDGWELYGSLNDAVHGDRALYRAVIAGAIIETANVIELIFDIPSGRSTENRFRPLVEMIPTEYPEAADLQSEHAQLDPSDVEWVRALRDSTAAHIDLKTPLHELIRRLDETDTDRLTTLFHFTVNALSRVDARQGITVVSPLVRMHRATMAGVSRVDPPAFSPDYEN